MFRGWKPVTVLATETKVEGPRGPYMLISRARFFLATKAATWLWFGMVIGIDHPHTNNSKYATYFEVYGAPGAYIKI